MRKFLKRTAKLVGLDRSAQNALFLYRNQKIKRQLQQYLTQGEKWSRELSIEDLRERSLNYFESLRIKQLPYGQYRYVPHEKEPNLYASTYAAMVRHLYGDLEGLSSKEREEWIQYLLSHQGTDGLFRDSAIDCPNARKYSSWGWEHLTLHVLGALTCLGGTAYKKFQVLEKFYDEKNLVNWLASRNWKNDPAEVSNEIQNIGVFLQYARDYQEDRQAGKVVKVLYDFLNERQDTKTGLWGNRFNSPLALSHGVQTGYHLWLLYFYDDKPIKYVDRALDSILKTQNKLGGFGINFNSSGCEDIDSIDPLVRFSFRTNYRKADIIKALKKALPWVFGNFNEDGSAVFRRLHNFECYHPKMKEVCERGASYPTWWRTLSLAYIGKVLKNTNVGKYNWRFSRIPGHQLWID